MPRPTMSRLTPCLPRAAFTLVELLAVIAVVGVLAAILLSVIARSRESARSAQCLANLRQLGQAVSLYAQDEKGYYPFGYIKDSGVRWHHQIHAFLGATRVGTSDKARSTGLLFCQQKPVKATESAALQTNYAGNPHLMPEKKSDESLRRRASAVQRPAQVILITDGSVNVNGAADWGFYNQTGWDKAGAALAETVVPNEEAQDHRRISWRHGGKTQAVFADGHAAAMAQGEMRYRHFRTDY